MSEKVLVSLKLNHFFKAIVGADAVKNLKPHADRVLATLAAMGCTAEDAVFVGDSATDVNAARNAGIPVIAITFGYSTIDPEDLGADDLVDDMKDLSFAIDDLRA